MKCKILFYAFSLLLFASCARENKKSAIIHSEAADSIFKQIFLTPSMGEESIFAGGTTFHFEVDSVKSFYISGGAPQGYFWTTIFVTPGDSINFTSVKTENGYELLFSGENAAHYNYGIEKAKAMTKEEPNAFANPDVDPYAYKTLVQAYCDEERKFLDEYKMRKKVSSEFLDYASAEINNKYVLKLYQYLFFYKCKVDVEKYLADAKIIQNPLSMYALEALKMKYVFCSSKDDILLNYNAIQKEVRAEFQPVLFAEFVKFYAQKGDLSYKSSLIEVMNKIEDMVKDSMLLATVSEYKSFYLMSGKALLDNVLDGSRLQCYQNNKEITLRQFLENYNNAAIYLGLWASWCGPCRKTNAQSRETKQELKDKGITVAYISLDFEKNSWEKAVLEDKITENQYLLLDVRESPLFAYLKIAASGIPRYLLFNKKHEVVLLNAPRPVGCLFQDLKTTIDGNPEDFVGIK